MGFVSTGVAVPGYGVAGTDVDISELPSRVVQRLLRQGVIAYSDTAALEAASAALVDDLSGVSNAAAARAALGLGTAAELDVGDLPAGGFTWTADINDPLTDISGSKLTTSGGTWTADAGGLNANTGGTQWARYNPAACSNPMCSILQVDIQMPSGADTIQGVYFCPASGPGADSSIFGIRMTTSAAANIDLPGVMSVAGVTGQSWPRAAWHTLRMVTFGGLATLFVDGVRYIEGTFDHRTALFGGGKVQLGVGTASATMKFRNLKVWSGALALPA